MAHHNPLKVVIPTFQMKLGELVRGFKSQLKYLDLLCLWSTVLEGPQCTWTNQTFTQDFLPSNASVSLSSPSQCTCPLPSSLTPSFCQYAWTAASVARCSLESYCCQDKTWLLYPPCGPGQSQNSQEPETMGQRKFSLSPKEQSRLWPSWRGDSEKVRPGRRQAARLRFLFQCHAFPRNRKKVPWPLPYV